MDAVSQQEMQHIESSAFDSGVKASDLMQCAGEGIAREVSKLYPHPGFAVAYIGKGNNGGDALVALHSLQQLGWQTAIRCNHTCEELSPLSKTHLSEYHQGHTHSLQQVKETIERTDGNVILLDGLLGIGSQGPLRAPLLELAGEMNHIGRMGARVIAMDLPSGIHANDGTVFAGAVSAHHTCSIALPKLGILKE